MIIVITARANEVNWTHLGPTPNVAVEVQWDLSVSLYAYSALVGPWITSLWWGKTPHYTFEWSRVGHVIRVMSPSQLFQALMKEDRYG